MTIPTNIEIAEYTVTIRVSFEIFGNGPISTFANRTDLTVPELLPLVLSDLILDDSSRDIANHSIIVKQLTSTTYKVECIERPIDPSPSINRQYTLCSTVHSAYHDGR